MIPSLLDAQRNVEKTRYTMLLLAQIPLPA